MGGIPNLQPDPPGRKFMSYMNPSGGLNTKDDQHAIERDQMAGSQNTWHAAAKGISKRPGSTAFVTATGATGTGASGTGIVAARFANVSYILSQQGRIVEFAKAADTAYTSISTQLGASPNRIHAAQMYDPTNATASSADGTLIICDGIATPKFWLGPGNTTMGTVNTSAGYLPINFTSSGNVYITPRFVLADGQNSNLVYAGEPTFPSAVYVSDPFFPEKFSFSASNTTSYPGTYAPYIIGQNDGVAGGDITGLGKLGTIILVTKQASIYFMTLQAVYGNLVYTSECKSASTGIVAPESLVCFDQFAVGLGNDGVYTIDMYGNMQQITRNIPTFFDNTLSGKVALCSNPTTAVGVRQGSRYILFYDSTGVGYPDRGLWFDFAKPDREGLPTTGEIIGYNVAGAVQLKGPRDDGNFIWTDAARDRIGKFGIGFSDFGLPITWSGLLKADMLPELYQQKSPANIKTLVNMWIDLTAPSTASSLQFYGTITTDYSTQNTVPAEVVTPVLNAAYYGSAHYGVDHYASALPNSQYFTARVPSQASAQGKTIQLGWTETSTNGCTVLGVTGEYNDKGVPGA